ncbi:MAG: tautomerase family protein [Chloroflexales bacterium]|nr:tautomerase family protein [Chloroflexales bacterium]
MPLVRIDLRAGTDAGYRQALAEGIHQALVETMGVPADDRFQIIGEQAPENLIADPQYLGIARSEAVVLVQVTLSAGRKPGQKRAFYARAAELLAERPGLRPQDLAISLVETSWENSSFGNGEAQYTQ